jgi:nucleotide-binding universal stress UspA family protein
MKFSRIWLFRKEAAMPKQQAFGSTLTRILLPVDFSPSSQTALKIASDLAGHFHANLYLVHVIPMFSSTTFADFAPEESALQDATRNAEECLTKCCASLADRGVKASYSVEIGNDTAGEILEAVEREHISLVVISTHGISGWHPLVFGSIAEKVVKLVQCPLLLLHSANSVSSMKAPSVRAMEWW